MRPEVPKKGWETIDASEPATDGKEICNMGYMIEEKARFVLENDGILLSVQA